MRLAGRIDPGNGAAVFTGHRVSLIPARIAATSARLSFLLRPGTDGTVIEGFVVTEVSVRGGTESALTALSASPAVTATGSSLGSADCSTGGEVFASFTAQAHKKTARPSPTRRKQESKVINVVCEGVTAE